MTATTSLEADGFHITGFNTARPFSSFLPGIAGEYGKPMWVFYTNRGQCISSFGVCDKNGAMLEFQPANKAYALTPVQGFRTFIKVQQSGGPLLYEPFQLTAVDGVVQRLCVRPEEIEIEETHATLGLRIRVVYFTLPNESLPALVRSVTVENIGSVPVCAEVLDGLPQLVPFGLEDRLLKLMSRTMEAFAEIRHVEENLPFFKLKVEPSDKPEVQWIDGGFFAFTVHEGQRAAIIVDPDLVFGSDTTLRLPLAFMQEKGIDKSAARRETLTGCAFAQLPMLLAPGQFSNWTSYFGQVPDWTLAEAFGQRVASDPRYMNRKRCDNGDLIHGLSAQFALIAGPKQLDAYTQQAFLDNTLRGGQPVVIDGPRGPRVFHTFTRKHGDMERDYNFFEIAASYWSQGNGNFRDINQNRRSENFIFPGIDAANIETFFDLIQIDGNNPLVIQAEKFRLPADQWSALIDVWPEGDTPAWRAFMCEPFSPGELLEKLVGNLGTPETARPWFDHILGLSDKVQEALHGEGYWVDHWAYNLDLIDSYASVFPDRMRELLLERCCFTYFDSDYVVLARDRKYLLRANGTVRQMHATVRDAGKAQLVSQRTDEPRKMRIHHGMGPIYRSTLLAKMLNLMVVKASLFDPFGVGLEMESEKPGWCDALNGLPGLMGSSTHEAFALQRWVRFIRQAVAQILAPDEKVSVPVEVATLLQSVTRILEESVPHNFFPSWQLLASSREAFRADVRLGIAGDEISLQITDILVFLSAVDRTLDSGLARSVDVAGLPISYYVNEVVKFELLALEEVQDDHTARPVRALGFAQKPIAAFLEGAVNALRGSSNLAQARALYAAVKLSALFDRKLGMYRVNAPLDSESFEIGRSRIFAPGWLENESIFLHMHYKFLLETLRSGLVPEFYEDLQRGLVAFHDPAVYGRSPLENSSFLASSRFPDIKVHGVGFVARLSGATAEWISMVLHMGLGPKPFHMLDGLLRFEPRPLLAGWLFTTMPWGEFDAGSFGFKLFGKTWIVYQNPSRRATFGDAAVLPSSFELHYLDGTQVIHVGRWLSERLALDLRNGKLARLLVQLA